MVGVFFLQEVINAEQQQDENGFNVDPSQTQPTNHGLAGNQPLTNSGGAVEPEAECDVMESDAVSAVDGASCESEKPEMTSWPCDNETGATTTASVVEDQLSGMQDFTTAEPLAEQPVEGFIPVPEVEVPEDQREGAPPEMVNQVGEKLLELQVDCTVVSESESMENCDASAASGDDSLGSVTNQTETPRPNQPPETGGDDVITLPPEPEMVNTTSDGVVHGEQPVLLADSTANDEKICGSSELQSGTTTDEVDHSSTKLDDVVLPSSSTSDQSSIIQPQAFNAQDSPEHLSGLKESLVVASEMAAEEQACGAVEHVAQCEGVMKSISVTDDVEPMASVQLRDEDTMMTSGETLTHEGDDDQSGTVATSTYLSGTALIYAEDEAMVVADAALPSGIALTSDQPITAEENCPDATLARHSGTASTDSGLHSSVTPPRSGSNPCAQTESNGVVDRRLTFTFPDPPQHPYIAGTSDNVADEVFVGGDASPLLNDGIPASMEEIHEFRGAPAAMTSLTEHAPAADDDTDDSSRTQHSAPPLGDDSPLHQQAPQPSTEAREVSAHLPGASSLHAARTSLTPDSAPAAAAAVGEVQPTKDAERKAAGEGDESTNAAANDELPAENFDNLKTSSSPSSEEPQRYALSSSESPPEGVDECDLNQAAEKQQSLVHQANVQQSCSADRHRQPLTLLIPGSQDDDSDFELQAVDSTDNAAQVSALCIHCSQCSTTAFSDNVSWSNSMPTTTTVAIR